VAADYWSQIAERASQPGEGATFDPKTGTEPTSGWAVARAGHEQVEPKQTFSEDSLKRYAGKNRDAIDQAGYMGLWHPSRVKAGRPKGVYMDVTEVKPDTYRGGLEAINKGYEENQDSIFNIDRFHEAFMRPETRAQRRATRESLRGLAAKRPAELGPERRISQMSPEELGAQLRGRR
jgi:hypothetical protein